MQASGHTNNGVGRFLDCGVGYFLNAHICQVREKWLLSSSDSFIRFFRVLCVHPIGFFRRHPELWRILTVPPSLTLMATQNPPLVATSKSPTKPA